MPGTSKPREGSPRKQILLVSPAQVLTGTSLSEARDILGSAAMVPTLALPTLAAMVPDDMDVTLVDEAVATLDFEPRWDFVGITGTHNHAPRMFEIAGEFRRRGVLVGLGGPFVSTSPERARGHGDSLFVGEGEEIWPAFLADLANGHWQSRYDAAGTADIQASPLPRYDKLPNDRYWMGVVQTSRGCPHQCEFCDVIVYMGRQQRYKTPEQVIREVEQVYGLGYRFVFLADDNFTGSRPKARGILRALAAWNRTKAEPCAFGTQLSIDVARAPDVLRLCAKANLRYAFVGVESPNPEALREANKTVNLRADLVGDIEAFFAHGIIVHGTSILGFDADTVATFQLHDRYLARTGIPVVSANTLAAPPKTPLAARLAREGRLTTDESARNRAFGTNIVPKNLSPEELSRGMVWLMNRIYDPSAFRDRLRRVAAQMPDDGAGPLCARDQAMWDRMDGAFASLGPAFAAIPEETRALFATKTLASLTLVLVFYKHSVAMLKKSGLWNPALAAREAP